MLKIFWTTAEGREKNRRPKKITEVMLSRVTTSPTLNCRQHMMQVTRTGLNSHDRLVVGRLWYERGQGYTNDTNCNHTHTNKLFKKAQTVPWTSNDFLMQPYPNHTPTYNIKKKEHCLFDVYTNLIKRIYYIKGYPKTLFLQNNPP